MVQRSACGYSSDWLVVSQHHQPSGSNWSGVCMLEGSIPSSAVSFSHLEGVSVYALVTVHHNKEPVVSNETQCSL